MLQIRPMTADGIELGQRLREQAGWNQTKADWQRFLELSPQGCFVAEWNAEPVGTTTTCVFGSVGWIAMVLVDKAVRHRGIGTRLVEHAVHFLESQAVRTIRLDATALGQPVYEQLGFVAEYRLARLEGQAEPIAEVASTVEPLEPIDLAELAALDQHCIGANRRPLLARLLAETPELAGKIVADGHLQAFVLGRRGTHAAQIGPASALVSQQGQMLLDWIANRCTGQPMFVDVPCDNLEALAWGTRRRLTLQRSFTRMSRGEPVRDQTTLLWASSGPEKG